MQKIDFDFARYVALRKGAQQAQLREGSAYAFSADVRMLKTLQRMGPVPTVLEEAGRLFQRQAQGDLLRSSVRATRDAYPKVVEALSVCTERLHLLVPPLFILQDETQSIPFTVGAHSDAHIFLPHSLVQTLSDDELLFVIGSECGRIQNGHIPLCTALFYVTHVPTGFIKFMVIPAKSLLSVWLRRANITADRAGLICSRNLEVCISALRKIVAGKDQQELAKRELALARFSESQYFRQIVKLPAGESQQVCDEAVALILDEKITLGQG